jgi:8-amino-7-oxononanoate synthase
LLALQRQLREGLSRILKDRTHLGWRLADSSTPIQPLVVGANVVAMALAAQLESAGFRVPGIRPPTVPVGQARLRITLCATHTTSDVDRLLQAIETAAQRMEAE